MTVHFAFLYYKKQRHSNVYFLILETDKDSIKKLDHLMFLKSL